MDDSWKDFIKKKAFQLFEIREGEFRKTILLQFNIFLIISSLLIVKPTINSLFLSELSAKALPLGYVLTAIVAFIGSFFYTIALEKYYLNKIIENTFIGSIISLLIFGLVFRFDIAHGLFYYIPYVWISLFGLLTASQFWILANLVYNIRAAKRVFGFIGAGAIAGGIFGGYITSILAQYIQAVDLLFIAAFLLSFCIPIVRYLWKREIQDLNDFQLGRRIGEKAENPIRIIRNSKLLSLIAIVIGISVLVAKLVDFQYSYYAAQFIPDPEELASFLGFWLSTLSLVSLLIQLFVTKRVVGLLGVGNSLLWLPSGILIGSVILILLPQLWVIVFIKVIDGSLKQSVNKAATELLSIPIPMSIKKKTKTFIDVVIDSISTGIAGFILIFFINGLGIPTKFVSLIIIALICVWIYIILQLKKEYIESFKKLFVNEFSIRKKEKTDFPVTTIVDSVKKVLSTGTEKQIIYMLQKTLEVKDERFFQVIKALVDHRAASVRSLAIENLSFLKTENLSALIQPMIYEDDQNVTTKAFQYLLKYHDGDTLELFNKYLDDPDSTIKNAALIGLSNEIRNNTVLQDRFEVNKRITKEIDQLDIVSDPEIRKNRILTIIEVIGTGQLQRHYSFIEKNLKNSDPDILKKAILAAGNSLQGDFIEQIVEFLSDKDFRETAKLGLFTYGETVIKKLVKLCIEHNIKFEDARFIPGVIEKFDSQAAVRGLLKLIEKSPHDIKIEAIESLSRLRWGNPNLEIRERLIVEKILDECDLYQTTLGAIHAQIISQHKKTNASAISDKERAARNGLIKTLENRLDRQLQRIFKFLGMKYPPDDIDPIFKVIVTGKEDQRIHAIEFLDNILDPILKKELIPIAESTLIDGTYDEKVKKLNIRIPSELECFTKLMERKDTKLKQSVLFLIEQMKDPSYVPFLQKYLEDDSVHIRSMIQEIINEISENNPV